jgi:hypothetical protein
MTKVTFLILFLVIGTLTFGQNKIDGLYVGLEPISWTLKNGKTEYYSDPAHPKRKWYHLTYLKIKGDTVFADQSPINIYRKDTSFSASDGAFYYYHGHVNQKDTSITIILNYIFCDYCPMPEPTNPNAYLFPWIKNYHCKLIADGLLINNYLFKKTDKKDDLISEHPEPYLQH